MNKKIDPFISIYPNIDLHGEDRIGAKVKVNSFIDDSLKLKNYTIVIIHGKGKGIVKESVYELLKNDKRVLEYKQDNFNNGITIVKLKK